MAKKILVCDDDQPVAEMIKVMLENNGYDVRLQFSGKAIQKRIKEYLPDLILLDIWMSGINGEEVAKILKRDEQIKHIPIIILSALHQNEIKAIIKRVEVEGFLSKPFNMADLLKMVVKYTS
ncbi:response regulator [Candidatus Daviesbacteria bacterium]|nr:response regulator [Candidatus Daviesbacteria bacterium]